MSWLIIKEGLQTRLAYKRGRLIARAAYIIFPDHTKHSCYLEADEDNVKDEEEVLPSAIDDNVWYDRTLSTQSGFHQLLRPSFQTKYVCMVLWVRFIIESGLYNKQGRLIIE